jgi:hypothetical protein
LTFSISGTMNADRYRFVAKSGGLTSPFGVALDGNGDGTAGDDFLREFGFRLQVSGTAYQDWDADGVRGVADPALPGTTIFADLNSNGSPDGGEPYAISNSTGAYTFGGLPTGNTVIRQIALSGYMTTGPASQTINLPTTTSTVANVDFGQIQSAPAVYGRVFTDTNGNGIPEIGESGQNGRAVFGDLNNNDVFDDGEPAATTDSLGNYRIPLDAGAYTIRLAYVAGMGATSPLNNLHSIEVEAGPVTGKNFGQLADADAPTGTVTVGSGQSRSRIESLTVTFSEVVTFTNNDPTAAFSLTRTGVGSVGLSTAVAIQNGQTVVTLNFLNNTQFGSLVDGRYVLTVDSSRIRDIALNQLTPIPATNFHRFFGDHNGDGNVDIADFGQFSSTYGLTSGESGFISEFDYNDDGVIDIADFGQFSIRIFTVLP